MNAEAIAMALLGKPNKRTLAPARIEALKRFPTDGRSIRASVYMRWKDYSILRDQGLVEGRIGWCGLTPLGLAVREVLLRNAGEG